MAWEASRGFGSGAQAVGQQHALHLLTICPAGVSSAAGPAQADGVEGEGRPPNRNMVPARSQLQGSWLAISMVMLKHQQPQPQPGEDAPPIEAIREPPQRILQHHTPRITSAIRWPPPPGCVAVGGEKERQQTIDAAKHQTR